MMTQKGANTKWCPFSRSHARDIVCLASDCMAWRWLDAPRKWIVDVPAYETPDREPVGHYEPIGDERRGFCGLAGQPEFG